VQSLQQLAKVEFSAEIIKVTFLR